MRLLATTLTKVLFIVLLCCELVTAQSFVHPGIDQGAADMRLMKQKILNNEQPWKEAYDRLKSAADTPFTVQPHTHVLRGPYGRPNIGGNELSKSADMAYNYALMWYISNEKKYAEKAVAIIDAWSGTIWDFDYNDAKLLAAWTGHKLCNAAEILRYSNSGWQPKSIEQFSNMLMTVYYPLLRFYYPQANGNWDGAIIHTILAIAVFTDNRDMFINAIDHYLHAPVNGSIFKYIYPSGQCQETMRDQAHVQLGLGEFAGAAQIAYTQGTDLYKVGNNRLALGYEYTASFLMGDKPHAYGVISERAKTIRDDYESVYRHYSAMGIEMPNTKRAADSIRPKASRSILSSIRDYSTKSPSTFKKLSPSPIGYIAGAKGRAANEITVNSISVSPGESIQDAMDKASQNNGVVLLKGGIHRFPATLRIPSGITLAGEGLSTVLFLDPASGNRDALVNAANDLSDIIIRDLVIEGGTRTEIHSDPNSTRSYRGGYNRGGIVFRALKENQMKNITLQNITLRNCTFNGVVISGGTNINIIECDFSENGGSVVPGPKLQHNLLLTYSNTITVRGNRLVTSPHGSGLALDHCQLATITNNEIARNAYYGILVTESTNITMNNNLVEANDYSGIMIEFLRKGSSNIKIFDNIIQYNNGFGIESYAASRLQENSNEIEGNGADAKTKISSKRFIVME